MDFTFENLAGLAGKRSIADVPGYCCIDQCKTTAGRKRECLRIYYEDDNFIRFNCGRCGNKGFVKPDRNAPVTKIERQEVPREDKAPLCNLLWDKSQPSIGSLAQTYLQSRQCWRICQQVRFLPGSAKYPPTMLTRFGFPGEPITGVHLTKLNAQGSGKAGTDADKITIGECVGQPLVLHVNEEAPELLIAEGIEDTNTLINVTGWNGWAAGTANRIPGVIETAVRKGYRHIYVAKDVDWINRHKLGRSIEPGASTDALIKAATITPVIPLWFGGLIRGMRDGMDANKMFINHGGEFLLAAIKLCELQYLYRRGDLTFHQFLRESLPCRKILGAQA